MFEREPLATGHNPGNRAVVLKRFLTLLYIGSFESSPRIRCFQQDHSVAGCSGSLHPTGHPISQSETRSKSIHQPRIEKPSPCCRLHTFVTLTTIFRDADLNNLFSASAVPSDAYIEVMNHFTVLHWIHKLQKRANPDLFQRPIQAGR